MPARAVAPAQARERLVAQARELLAVEPAVRVLVRTLAKGPEMREVGRVQLARYQEEIVAKTNQKVN